jgi:hypothetical protein
LSVRVESRQARTPEAEAAMSGWLVQDALGIASSMLVGFSLAIYMLMGFSLAIYMLIRGAGYLAPASSVHPPG